MKKILFLHSSAELYGSDKSLLYLLENINKDEYKVDVLLPEKGPLYFELEKINCVTVKVFEVAVLRRKNFSLIGLYEYGKDFMESYNFIKKYIKHNNIDIVYTNTAVVFPGVIAAKHSKRKSVWHIREIIKNSTERNVIRMIVNHYADIIIANSKSTGEAICNNKKLRIVYNAVDNKSATVREREKKENFVIGMAGRINRWKGQKLFVDAAEIIHKKYPDVIFNIAGAAYKGEEWIEEELKEYIEEKKLISSVNLVGLINDMDEFYNSIDIFVLPSIQPEPFGLVVLEAMEMKKPVIATNHGGPAEIIDNCEDGYLVDYNEANEMAERCMQLIQDEKLRLKIGNAGYYKKRKYFSVQKTVKNIEEVLNEL